MNFACIQGDKVKPVIKQWRKASDLERVKIMEPKWPDLGAPTT